MTSNKHEMCFTELKSVHQKTNFHFHRYTQTLLFAHVIHSVFFVFNNSLYRATSQEEAEDKFNAFMQRLPVFVTIGRDVSVLPPLIMQSNCNAFERCATHTAHSTEHRSADVHRLRPAEDRRRSDRESVLVDCPPGGQLQSDRSDQQSKGAGPDRLSGSHHADDAISGMHGVGIDLLAFAVH